jgi:hypothetical protein
MLARVLLLSLLCVSCAWSQAPGFTRSDVLNQLDQERLTATDRQQVLDQIVARLHYDYVLPDIAARMIDMLHANARRGAYDTQFDGPGFADRLTADLQAVSDDQHLRVGYSLPRLPEEDAEASPDDRQAYQGELDETNCGFQSMAILPGNFGYLHLTYFGAPDACADAAATAFRFLAHTRGLVFDLRQNRGGDPRMVALLESYLFDRSVHTDDIYNRREKKTTQYWTHPEKLEVRMTTQPVYILTSRLTFSAAEQFCYDLKNLGRALLIGERTGGASHPIRNRRINDHFFISMPEYRYISPITSKDWEGQGVAPDVPAAPWNAIMLAQRIAQTRPAHPATPPAARAGTSP